MTRTYEKQGVAERYDAARGLPSETAALWMHELRQLLPARPIRLILDLGCGTGRFTGALRTAFACPVVGVEPSASMLGKVPTGGPAHTFRVRAKAEAIPLRDRAAGLIWMSQVYHHLEQPAASFAEMRRVLVEDGCLAIRNGTRENNIEIEWLQCFPEALAIDNQRIPRRDDLLASVRNLGFQPIATKTIYQYFAASYAEYYDKIAQRGLSALVAISDDAFHAGLERLKRYVEAQPPDKPVLEPVDLFVFEKKR